MFASLRTVTRRYWDLLKMLRRFVKFFDPMRSSLVSGRQWAGSSAYEQNRVTKESQLTEALKKTLPGIVYVSVQDISGGCGDMFEVNIEAKEFKGLSTVKQHRLVTDSLKNEIQKMHGIRIHTSVPHDT